MHVPMYDSNFIDHSPKPPMLDEWSGRYLPATIVDVEKALLDSNTLLLEEGELDLNTFYDQLGLPPIPMGSGFGWSVPDVSRLDITFGSIIMPDGWPALVFTFRQSPRPVLGR